MLYLRFAVRHQRTWLYLMLAAAFCALALTGTPPGVSGASIARHADDVQAAPANHVPQIPPGFAYRQTNLASDVPGLALIEDPLLINPWGISLSATGPFWIANGGMSTSSIYRGDANGVVLFKQPNLPSITIPDGGPRGTVANPTANEFVLPGTCAAAPCVANVIFATVTGKIMGWNPNAPAAGSTTGVIAASQPKGYTGLAIGNNGSGNFLYAAGAGRIDVFNSSYELQPAASFPFADPTIPNTPGNR